jgi:molecular chaperone Hsp33
MMKKPDQLYRYLFEHYQVRGELVQLDETFHQMVAAQTYPEPVRQLLGELLVATSLLTATLKFSGAITVQLQGNGPVRLAVINGDHQQQLRRDGAGKFQGRSEQAGRYQQFAQQLAYRLRICLGRHHLVKGLIQLHQFAADLVVFE